MTKKKCCQALIFLTQQASLKKKKKENRKKEGRKNSYLATARDIASILIFFRYIKNYTHLQKML